MGRSTLVCLILGVLFCVLGTVASPRSCRKCQSFANKNQAALRALVARGGKMHDCLDVCARLPSGLKRRECTKVCEGIGGVQKFVLTVMREVNWGRNFGNILCKNARICPPVDSDEL